MSSCPSWDDYENSILEDALRQTNGAIASAARLCEGRLDRSPHAILSHASKRRAARLQQSRPQASKPVPPPLLPWGAPPLPCPQCGSGATAMDVTLDGDYCCVICGTVQYVAARVRGGRG